jgi:5-methylcytosine-specific restriction endonuclease McrA
MKSKRSPKCHPDRKYHAKDLCKYCYRKTIRENHKEKIAIYMKDYWKENKCRLSEYNKRYRELNSEKLHIYETQLRPNKNSRLEYSKDYQHEKPESHRKASYKWAMSESERAAASTRRALKRTTADGSVTSQTIQEMFSKQNGLCKNSLCKAILEDNYHIEHIIPISKGGKHSIYNIQLVCPYCNLTKSTKIFSYI